MRILYLVKQCPTREYTISNVLKERLGNCEIDGCAFSNRIYLDLFKLNEEKRVFTNTYDFTKYIIEENYNSINFDEELYEFERKFNLPINKILHADRTIINYEDINRKKIIFNLIKFALKIIEENDYEFFIGELSSSSDLIFYYLSRFFGKKYIFFWHGRTKDRMEFSDLEGNRLGLKEFYETYKTKGIDESDNEFLHSYLTELEKDITPDYMKFSKQTKLKNLYKKTYIERSTKRLKKYIQSYFIDKKYSADQSPAITEKVRKKLKKISFPIKSVALKSMYDDVKLNKKYYLVPLHFQPESSTMTFATYYLNQMAFIENLSKCISGGTYIYVKEHPAMFANRKISFYKELKKIPNIKLVNPDFRMNELIKNSIGIVTLTNTTGYEAIILDKPVFVFGDVFYKEFDYCYRCDSFIKFRENVMKAINEWDDLRDERLTNRNAFILACQKSLRQGNLNSHLYDISFFDEKNINNIVSNIIIEAKI